MTDDAAVLGIDLGTQGVRVEALSRDGATLADARRGWSITAGDLQEQDPATWWDAMLQAVREVAAAVPGRIQALSVAATSGTLVLADEHLQPVRPAILWHDKRAVREAARAAEVLGENAIRPGFTLAKAMWVREHEPEAWARTRWVLSAGDWMLARLTGAAPVTDPTNALKTGADLDELVWPTSLEACGIDRATLPSIVPTGSLIGTISEAVQAATGLPPETTVHAGVTDANAAQIAAGVVDVGDWVTTIGTGLSIKGVTRSRIRDDVGALYSHRHWSGGWIPSGTSHCGAESLATRFAGEDLQALTAAASEPSDMLVLPLSARGEYFPFRNADATGFEVGAPRSRADHFRAYLEGIAFVERLAMERMAALGADVSGPQATMGGGAGNDTWMRIRATVLGRPTTRPANTSSAVGAAVIAAAADPARITASARAMVRPGAQFEPDAALTAHYDSRYAAWLHELASRGYLPGAS